MAEGTTFFFRNFLEGCKGMEIRKKFEELGRVRDVYISEKKDKKGKRFGFVRFLGWIDEEEMLRKLNRVLFGSFIIRAYIPRFNRPVRGDERDSKKLEWFGGTRTTTESAKELGQEVDGTS